MRLAPLALAALIPLAACSTVKEAVKGPNLTPVGYPASLVPQNQEMLPLAASAREPLPTPAGANSLWRTGARAFFIDQRASRVGDAAVEGYYYFGDFVYVHVDVVVDAGPHLVTHLVAVDRLGDLRATSGSERQERRQGE